MQDQNLETSEFKTQLEQKFKHQEKVISHKQQQIDDLRETISMKITVADDLSSLLKQQKSELLETKSMQAQTIEKAKKEMQDERHLIMSERDELLQKLWSSKSEVQQLRSLNSEIIGEITQLKSTIKKVSKASALDKSPSRRQKQKPEEIFNPVVTQLDNMKSTYKSKLVSIQNGLGLQIEAQRSSNSSSTMRQEHLA